MKKLAKSSDKMIDGVLGGFSEYFEIDPVWLRLGYVVLAIVTGFFIAIVGYIIAAIIMPKSDSDQAREETVEQIVIEGEIIEGEAEGTRSTGRNRFNLIIGLSLILVGIGFIINQIYHINLWNYAYTVYHNVKYYAWAAFLIIIGLLIIIKGRK